LRRIFGPKREEVTEEWRKLYNDEIHDLYCSPTIVRVIKSGRMRWAGHVARMGEGKVVCKFVVTSVGEGKFVCKFVVTSVGEGKVVCKFVVMSSVDVTIKFTIQR
jgi:hypothetical protein